MFESNAYRPTVLFWSVWIHNRTGATMLRLNVRMPSFDSHFICCPKWACWSPRSNIHDRPSNRRWKVESHLTWFMFNGRSSRLPFRIVSPETARASALTMHLADHTSFPFSHAGEFQIVLSWKKGLVSLISHLYPVRKPFASVPQTPRRSLDLDHVRPDLDPCLVIWAAEI
jgi:hypothetical protein